MDGCGRAASGYSPPRITDYGTLVDLTADGGVMTHVGLRIAQVSAPSVPGGGGDVVPETASNGVLGQGDSGGDGVGGEDGGGAGGASGGGGGGSGGGGGGGKLPFTGFAAGALGAVGAGLSAAGLALRERMRRKP